VVKRKTPLLESSVLMIAKTALLILKIITPRIMIQKIIMPMVIIVLTIVIKVLELPITNM